MKAAVTKFKSMNVALAELAPHFNARTIKSGKPLKRFDDMRPREAIANWLICVALNKTYGEGRMEFTSDPTGSDGLMCDTVTGEVVPTEHVIALPAAGRTGDEAILAAIAGKVAKGDAYARGKSLIVLAEGIGMWTPRNVAQGLPSPVHFASVYVVGTAYADGVFAYDICRISLDEKPSPLWRVTIDEDFKGWTVTP